MSRRVVLVVALTLVTAAFLLGGCLGGDDEEATSRPAPAETPSATDAPPSPTGLPPELVKCFADRGFDVESPTEIHSAPPQVVQACFGALHQGVSP